MGSGAMTYVPHLIKIDAETQTLKGDTRTHRQREDRISLLSFFFKVRRVGQKL
jgi:hypothetical protein